MPTVAQPSPNPVSRHSRSAGQRLPWPPIARRLARIALLWAVGLPGAGLTAAENLVVNGGFEKGKGKQAAGWSRMDGITTFWERKGGRPGACLRFDPDVQQKDKKAFLENPEAFKGKGKGGQYSTVGAHEGVWAFSQPIPVAKDDRYFLIEADLKGPAKSTSLFYPQVFIRGYQKFSAKRDAGTSSWFQTPHEGGPAYSEQFGKDENRRPAREGDYLMVYRHSLVCRLPDAGKWYHYQMGVKVPTMKKYRPDVLLLKLYAMWPLGDYFFDNISLRRVSKAEFDAAKRKGHSIKGFMPTAEE